MSDCQNVGARPGAAGLPIRDEDAALAAAGNDSGLARELLGTLIGILPQELAQMRSLYDASDWHGLNEVVHRLRGATAYCAVPALDEALSELKEAAKAGDARRIAEDLQRAEHEADRLAEEYV